MPVPSTVVRSMLLPLLLTPLMAVASPAYTVRVLDQFGSSSVSINAAGQVAGTVFPNFDTRTAASYSNGSYTRLGTLGGATSFANGINDAGAITGVSDLAGGASSHAFLSTGTSLRDLGTLGGAFSSGAAVNNTGQVVGFADTAAGQSHAFLYSAGAMRDLGTLGGSQSVASAINQSGAVAGYAYGAGDTAFHAFVYASGSMTDLGTLGGMDSYATGINGRGQVTGYATGIDGTFHAFLYAGGAMTDLGNFGSSAVATSINDKGQIVGYAGGGFTGSAFIYSQGGMRALDTLIDPATGWFITSAGSINNLGQIAAFGTRDGISFSALLLDPTSAVPEPATYAMLLLGLGCMGWLARRRRCD